MNLQDFTLSVQVPEEEVRLDMFGYPNKPIYKDMKFKQGVIPIMRLFKQNCPYKLGEENRKQGLIALNQFLSAIYQIECPLLAFEDINDEHSFGSSYDEFENKITLRGKLSIITFLHEFAHARGADEERAVLWSLSLFKRIYPIAFGQLVADKHTLVAK